MAEETFAEKMTRPSYRAAFEIKNTIINAAAWFCCAACAVEQLEVIGGDEDVIVDGIAEIIEEHLRAAQKQEASDEQ